MLEYTNPTSTVLDYKLYESSTPVTGEPTCNLSNETVDGAIQYSYNCTGLNYGTELTSGTLEANKTNGTLDIPKILSIADNSTYKYYYIVVDYPDNGDQSADQGKTIKYTLKTATDLKFKGNAKNADGTSSGMLATLRSLNSNISASKGVRTDFGSRKSTVNHTYEAEDDLGTSYYFAGAVNTNWVNLGSTYWRIVRINGNGSVRLIYSGTVAPNSSTATTMTGEGTQIGKSMFNNDNKNYTYVGYMYGSIGATTWAETHSNTNDSSIKSAVDEWYENNKSNFENLIDINVGFCGDRSASETKNGTPNVNISSPMYYGAYIRLLASKSPDITCNKSDSTLYNNDLYTKFGASIGNKALTNPVGLITADEIALAGGVYGTENFRYYLYTGEYYWTMSPFDFINGYSHLWIASLNGELNFLSNGSYGIRPVINLKSNLTWSGTGEWDSPFQVSLN